MKNFLFLFLLFFGLATVTVHSCKHEPLGVEDDDDDPVLTECHPDTIYFSRDLLPILANSCARSGCHDATTQADGVRLTNYASVMATADVRPGNPGGSDLYEVLIDDEPENRMPPPPDAPLTAAQIQMFFTWINQGAKNLTCNEGECDLNNVTFSQTVFPILQNNACVGCHSGSAPSGGVLLDSYNSVAAAATSGKLMGAIRHLSGYAPMPPSGTKISQCHIDQIQKWIDNGTLNN